MLMYLLGYLKTTFMHYVTSEEVQHWREDDSGEDDLIELLQAKQNNGTEVCTVAVEENAIANKKENILQRYYYRRHTKLLPLGVRNDHPDVCFLLHKCSANINYKSENAQCYFHKKDIVVMPI